MWRYIVLIFTTHCIQFLCEVLYHKICFPLSLKSFLTSLYSNEHIVCEKILNTSMFLHSLKHNTYIHIFAISYTIINRVSTKFDINLNTIIK